MESECLAVVFNWQSYLHYTQEWCVTKLCQGKVWWRISGNIDIIFPLVDGHQLLDSDAAWGQIALHTAEPLTNQILCSYQITWPVVKFDPLTFTLTSSSKIMQMKPLGVKLCCLIGHMTTMGVVSLCISLPSGGHPEGIQKYLIPIYQVGNQWVVIKPRLCTHYL